MSLITCSSPRLNVYTPRLFCIPCCRMTLAMPPLSNAVLLPLCNTFPRNKFPSAPHCLLTSMPTRTVCLSRVVQRASRKVRAHNPGSRWRMLERMCVYFAVLIASSSIFSSSGGACGFVRGSRSALSKQSLPHQREQDVWNALHQLKLLPQIHGHQEDNE